MGDDAYAVVESRTKMSVSPDQHDNSRNLNGYLLKARVGTGERDPAPLVFGPLWTVSGPIATFTHEVSNPFTPEAQSKPQTQSRFNFEASGALIRTSASSRIGLLDRSRLIIDRDSASWVFEQTYPMPRLSRSRVIQLEGNQNRYLVTRDGEDRVVVYDQLLGKQLDDSWLVTVLTGVVSRDDLENSRLLLTNEKDWLVVFPFGRYKNITRFIWDGDSYPRDRFGLAFRRPETQGKVFAGLRGPLEVPLKPVSIEGELFFFQIVGNQTLKLLNLDGEVKYELKMATPFENQDHRLDRIEVSADSESQRLVLDVPPGLISGESSENDVEVVIWRFRDGKLSRFFVPIRSAFDLTDTGYIPKRLIRIADQPAP